VGLTKRLRFYEGMTVYSPSAINIAKHSFADLRILVTMVDERRLITTSPNYLNINTCLPYNCCNAAVLIKSTIC
jgi:hypothetical protein